MLIKIIEQGMTHIKIWMNIIRIVQSTSLYIKMYYATYCVWSYSLCSFAAISIVEYDQCMDPLCGHCEDRHFIPTVGDSQRAAQGEGNMDV